MQNTINTITTKQINFIKKLDETIELKNIEKLTTIEASILIRKLLKKVKPNKTKTQQDKPKEEIKRNHNIKVGDIFYASWGYEQTNINFFLVAELVGASSARILPVNLEVKEEETMSHGMARYATFDIKDYTIISKSGFIKDCIKGDLKRILRYGSDGKEYIKIDSFCNAHKYNGTKLYNSWYY